MRLSLPILAVIVLSTSPARASSDDAWVLFRTEVEAACRALVQGPDDIVVEVNPFGSQSYGAAIVTATGEGSGADRMICIYDKVAKTAELTTPY